MIIPVGTHGFFFIGEHRSPLTRMKLCALCVLAQATESLFSLELLVLKLKLSTVF